MKRISDINKIIDIIDKKGSLSFIRGGGDINVVEDKTGKGLLHVYILKGETGKVGKLIKQGLDINQKDDNGNTPLHLAIKRGTARVIKYLLKYKTIDLEVKNNNYQTPLQYSVQEKGSLIKELINKGADTNILDKDGETLLTFAIKNNEEFRIKELIKGKIDVNKSNEQLESPILLASTYSLDKIAKRIVKSSTFDIEKSFSMNLTYSIKRNIKNSDNSDFWKELNYRVNKYASVGFALNAITKNISHENGMLIFLTHDGSPFLSYHNIKSSMEHGLEPSRLLMEDTSDEFTSPLEHAIRFGRTATIKLMMDYTVRNFPERINYHTLLSFIMLAIREEKFDSAETLINYNKSIFLGMDHEAEEILKNEILKSEQSIRNKNNILHLALKSGDKTLINKLFSMKETEKYLNEPNSNGDTPSNLKSHMGLLMNLGTLKNKQPSVENPIKLIVDGLIKELKVILFNAHEANHVEFSDIIGKIKISSKDNIITLINEGGIQPISYFSEPTDALLNIKRLLNLPHVLKKKERAFRTIISKFPNSNIILKPHYLSFTNKNNEKIIITIDDDNGNYVYSNWTDKSSVKLSSYQLIDSISSFLNIPEDEIINTEVRIEELRDMANDVIVTRDKVKKALEDRAIKLQLELDEIKGFLRQL